MDTVMPLIAMSELWTWVLVLVVVVPIVGYFLVGWGLMLGMLGFLYFKPRRWYRIVKAAGDEFDDDGLRIHRHPDHGEYYVRGYTILLRKHGVDTGWFTNEPKWLPAYSGRHDRLYWTRRSRPSKKVPNRITCQDIEWLRPVMVEIDKHEHRFRYNGNAHSVSGDYPNTEFTCAECGETVVGLDALNDHRRAAHPVSA